MMKRAVMMLGVLVAVACTEKPAPPAAAAPPPPKPQTTLTLKFDGGYAFVAEKDGTLTVAAPNDKGASQRHLAPLLSDLNQPINTAPYNLDHYAVSIVGLKSGAVSLPSGPPITYQKPANCSPEVQAEAQSSLPLSALTELQGPADFSDADLDGRLTLSGGSLRILQTHGCWTLGRQAARGMVTGQDSVQFSTVLDGDGVELELKHLATGETKNIKIPATNGAVVLRLGWPEMPGEPRVVGQRMADFIRYYRLVKTEAGPLPRRFALTDSEQTKPAPKGKDTEQMKERPSPDCGSIFIRR